MTINWRMSRIALIVGVFAVCTVAGLYETSAADLSAPTYRKAPVPTTTPVYSWTGFYIGASAGWGWSNPSTSLSGLPVGGWDSDPAVPASYSPSVQGFIGGGQIGYNFQMSSVVFGAEADLSYTHIRGSAAQSGLTRAPILPFVYSQSQGLEWFGTARGRVGLALAPTWMIYATGGLAFGEVNGSTSLAFTARNILYLGSASATKAGWTVGGGTEFVLTGRWTAKFEYLYYDLGTLTVIGNPVIFGPFQTDAEMRMNGQIIRIGINYKLGG